jgi:hypothetical protein
MKSLSIAILAIGVIAAIILKPDFWLPTMVIGVFGAIAIDEVD